MRLASVPSSTRTSSTSMRGSQWLRASRTWCAMFPRVVALFGANTYSWMPQPNAGCIGRSPLAVPSTIQIASLTYSSPRVNASEPAPFTRIGNLQPTPRNSRCISILLRHVHQGPGHPDGAAHREVALDPNTATARRRDDDLALRGQSHRAAAGRKLDDEAAAGFADRDRPA